MSEEGKSNKTVVMKLTLETHYVVELDEFGNSIRHGTKDLGEMARYDASCFSNGELEIDNFLRNHCSQSQIAVEPVCIDEVGTA